MNLDFHYYGTYLAAYTAGYSTDEAKVIAYAAQFVDDCTTTVMPWNGPKGQISTGTTIADVVTNGLSPKPFSSEDINSAEQLWSYFHFLPGNFNRRQSYNGTLEDSSLGTKWTYNGSAREDFQLMCLPESKLSKAIIDDIKSPVYTDNLLEMIGLRMHVIADTWAHSYFAGVPEWFLNEIDLAAGIEEFYDEEWHPIQLGGDLDDPLTYTYSSYPTTLPRYVSPFYLGHGKLGHIPDYGYIRYRYHPLWKNQLDNEASWQYKDNRYSFIKAFEQMVQAMKSIREGTEFSQVTNPNSLDLELLDSLKDILSHRECDLSSYWNALIEQIVGEPLAPYKVNSWVNTCSASDDPSSTNYYRFANAAIAHHNFVKTYIETKIPNRFSKPFTVDGAGENRGCLDNGVLKVGNQLQVIIDGKVTDYYPNLIPGIEFIKLVASDNPIHEFNIIVRGSCIKGKWHNKLFFTDKTGDTYSIGLVDANVKNHVLKFNSTYSDIVRISWHI